MRRHDLALVLREVVAAEPVSRAAIAGRAGLTRGTVSSLVQELLDAELLTELDATRGRPGRPANPLQLNRSGPAGLGVEIGVDHVAACVVDLTGAVRATRTAASGHRESSPSVGLVRAAALADEVGLPVVGAGLALPGLVGAELSALLDDLPVRCGNEADLAALARAVVRRRAPGFVHVSGGVGVGVGIVLGGRLFRGAGGRAGEIGHVVVDPAGPACRCGRHGCLEQVAGAEALARSSSAADVARALGIALSAAVHLLDVPAVILGGVYPTLGDDLRSAVAAQLAARLHRPDVTVVLSAPDTGGALRAAATAVVRARLRHP